MHGAVHGNRSQRTCYLNVQAGLRRWRSYTFLQPELLVVRGIGRPVPTHIRSLDTEIDVANFGSRFVPLYTAIIWHQSRPFESCGDGSIDVKKSLIKRVKVNAEFISYFRRG